jgi:hypothetical protein
MPTGVRPSPFIAAAVLTPFLVACGSSAPRLNISTVERAIVHSVRIEHHLKVSAACPPAIERRAGVTFVCRVELAAGSYEVNAVETNGDGRVRYENRAPLVVLDTAAVERAIDASLAGHGHPRAKTSCPGPVLQRRGVSFTCSATAGNQSWRFRVTVANAAGRVDYRELI